MGAVYAEVKKKGKWVNSHNFLVIKKQNELKLTPLINIIKIMTIDLLFRLSCYGETLPKIAANYPNANFFGRVISKPEYFTPADFQTMLNRVNENLRRSFATIQGPLNEKSELFLSTLRNSSFNWWREANCVTDLRERRVLQLACHRLLAISPKCSLFAPQVKLTFSDGQKEISKDLLQSLSQESLFFKQIFTGNFQEVVPITLNEFEVFCAFVIEGKGKKTPSLSVLNTLGVENLHSRLIEILHQCNLTDFNKALEISVFSFSTQNKDLVNACFEYFWSFYSTLTPPDVPSILIKLDLLKNLSHKKLPSFIHLLNLLSNQTSDLQPKTKEQQVSEGIGCLFQRNRGIAYEIFKKIRLESSFLKKCLLELRSSQTFDAILSEALKKNPEDPFTYMAAGGYCMGLGRHGPAIYFYSKAIEIEPQFVRAYLERGYAYLHLNDRERSHQDFKVVEEAIPLMTFTMNAIETALMPPPPNPAPPQPPETQNIFKLPPPEVLEAQFATQLAHAKAQALLAKERNN